MESRFAFPSVCDSELQNTYDQYTFPGQFCLNVEQKGQSSILPSHPIGTWVAHSKTGAYQKREKLTGIQEPWVPYLAMPLIVTSRLFLTHGKRGCDKSPQRDLKWPPWMIEQLTPSSVYQSGGAGGGAESNNPEPLSEILQSSLFPALAE